MSKFSYINIKKIIRYVHLYGINRTVVKIKGTSHSASQEEFDGKKWVNAKCNNINSENRRVAIIGCGNFAFTNIAYYLSSQSVSFLRATFDIDKKKSLSLCRSYGGLYATNDINTIIDDPDIKIVYIASNHATHAEYAILCIKAGKHVHIEKPHVVNQEQLDGLIAAMIENPKSKVYLGFNRTKSSLFGKLQNILESETGSMMINWFIAGHKISDDHWYFNESEGGRVLGNLTHWTDLTLKIVKVENAFPCTIIPATPKNAKSDFVVSIIFNDDTCAALTFSAKGETFEGVREILNIQKGNILANLTDFQRLSYEIIDKKTRISLLHRDHGHKLNIVHSFVDSLSDKGGESVKYIDATARFFLAIQKAVVTGETVKLTL